MSQRASLYRWPGLNGAGQRQEFRLLAKPSEKISHHPLCGGIGELSTPRIGAIVQPVTELDAARGKHQGAAIGSIDRHLSKLHLVCGRRYGRSTKLN